MKPCNIYSIDASLRVPTDTTKLLTIHSTASKPTFYRALPIQADPLPSTPQYHLGEQTSDGEIEEEQRDGQPLSRRLSKGSVQNRGQSSTLPRSDQNLIVSEGIHNFEGYTTNLDV